MIQQSGKQKETVWYGGRVNGRRDAGYKEDDGDKLRYCKACNKRSDQIRSDHLTLKNGRLRKAAPRTWPSLGDSIVIAE